MIANFSLFCGVRLGFLEKTMIKRKKIVFIRKLVLDTEIGSYI